MLPQTALFFHIAGIMLIGGGSISAILGEKQLWKKVNVLSPDARGVGKLRSICYNVYIHWNDCVPC